MIDGLAAIAKLNAELKAFRSFWDTASISFAAFVSDGRWRNLYTSVILNEGIPPNESRPHAQVDLKLFKIVKMTVPKDTAFGYIEKMAQGLLHIDSIKLQFDEMTQFSVETLARLDSHPLGSPKWPSVVLSGDGANSTKIIDEESYRQINRELMLLPEPYKDMRDATRDNLLEEIGLGYPTRLSFVAPIFMALRSCTMEGSKAKILVECHRSVRAEDVRLGFILRKEAGILRRGSVDEPTDSSPSRQIKQLFYEIDAEQGGRLDVFLVLREKELIDQDTYSLRK